MRKWLLLLALLLGACSAGQTQAPYRPPALAESHADGAQLYARECAWCHGASGEGIRGNGPNLDGELDGGAYTHFMLSTGRMPINDPQTRAIRQPVTLTAEEIDSLVDHVISFGGDGPGMPHPDPSRGSVTQGLDLYLTNCAACHSSTGTGGALTSGEVAPPLDNPDITPTQIAEAMLVGPGCDPTDPECGRGSGAMPNFDFDDQEVDSIVAYVRHLQEGGNAGGWSLGRVGPVTEGAAAWMIGLMAMLGAGRWIGTRMGEDE